jgi:predicted DNA binding CopG/RHH family protein
MSEQERAAYYQEHKDDEELWGETEERDAPRARHTLSISIAVRFSPDDAERIRDLAQESGLSYSDIVRAAVRQYTVPLPPIVGSNVTHNVGRPVVVQSARPEVTLGEDFQGGSALATQSRSVLAQHGAMV